MNQIVNIFGNENLQRMHTIQCYIKFNKNRYRKKWEKLKLNYFYNTTMTSYASKFYVDYTKNRKINFVFQNAIIN